MNESDSKIETILVVDDSEDNRTLIGRILQRAGFAVVEAEDGPAALASVAARLPDLILLDILMPGPDGFEVCSRLKADPRTAAIPVIFLSALDETKDKIRGFEVGGADYVTKPFNRGEILARVQSHLNIKRLTSDLRQANQELRDKQQRLDDDLKAAAGIQQSLLPQNLPDLGAYEAAWQFLPSEQIGGDIFNLFLLDEDHLALYILDVSGHGVPAALVTVSVSQVLSARADGILKRKTPDAPFYQVAPPRQVLEELEAAYPLERFDKFFTLVYAVLHLPTGRLTYSRGGHPPPVLLRADGALELLEEGGPLIGMGGIVPFFQGEKTLRPGDKLVFYTDGVVEYQGPGETFYGVDRLHGLLSNSRADAIGELLMRVVQDVTAFGDASQIQDDVSLLGLAFRG